jgi:hypothetical protein
MAARNGEFSSGAEAILVVVAAVVGENEMT